MPHGWPGGCGIADQVREGHDEQAARLDAVTEIVLREAVDERWSSPLPHRWSSSSRPLIEPIAVLDDEDAALTLALVARGISPRTWCDDLRDEEAARAVLLAQTVMRANAEISPTIVQALDGARTVLWRLPKAVSAVDEYAELIARHAAPDVLVVAGGRDKHLSRSMNEALARHFSSVVASRGARKARALVARGPVPVAARWPQVRKLEQLDLLVAAHGATFNTNRLDRGTALLISCFDRLPHGDRAIDLGCGSGLMAALLARQGRSVTAADVTWSACDAARRTAEANGLGVEVFRRDGLDGWAELVDLIVLNPPFHVRSAKDTEPTRRLFEQAGRALRQGGELWCVYNSHLPYLDWIRALVGTATIAARDSGYVTVRAVVTESGANTKSQPRPLNSN